MPLVEVRGIPDWLDAPRLLGAGDWEPQPGLWTSKLPAREAADVQARLRNLVLGGSSIEVRVRPGLKRSVVRAARSEDARRRRQTTQGFERPEARLDDEGRISLTPEKLALQLAERVAGQRVVDACCGCGGNAIAFARAGCSVVALDTDPGRIELARHNARTYGVQVDFRVADAAALDLEGDLLFVDPPWSEPDLAPLDAVLAAGRGRFAQIWAKVPPGTDPQRIPGSDPEAIFGVAAGDRRRVKFLVLKL